MPQAIVDWTHAWPTHQRSANDSSGLRLQSVGTQGQKASVADYIQQFTREIPSLPFLTLPFAEELTKQLEELTPFIRKFRHMLVLGIGGSALGARALQKSFFPQQDRPGHMGPWLWIADNLDPAAFTAFMDTLPPEETLVVVISKSGGTVETMAQYLVILPWLQKHLPASWQEHLLLVTDAEKGFLRAEATTLSLRSLPVPDNLGGRYSVLSAVGLVPAVFMGIDWKNLLRGAQEVGRPLAQQPALLPDHPAWQLAVWASRLMAAQFNQLIFFSYIPSMAAFGPWFSQLWAESLGKNGKGSMPVPAVGVTDQHSLLQMFLDGPLDKGCLFLTSPAAKAPALPTPLPEQWQWLKGKSLGDILEAETLATKMSLSGAGLPLVELHLPKADEHCAGRLMMLLEATTIFTGWLLDINPVDQPAVEEGKLLAKAQLGAGGLDKECARLQAFLKTDSLRTPF